MSLKIWLDGKLVDKQHATVSVYDHGLLYGDGVFEGIRVYRGKVFEADAHLKRLYDSARAIRLTIPYPLETLRAATDETFKANGFDDCYIRLVVTRGNGALGINPATCPKPAVFIIADSINMYPKEMYERGMAVITASVIRTHPNSLSPRIKSLNYLNNILAKIEGIQQGCLESLMLNHKGEIAECSGDNIFLVKGGVLRTPPIDAGILEGITRDVVIGLARDAKIEVQEIALTRHDVFVADECFLTGTAAELIPVVKCDGRVIGSGKPGPLTKRLHEAFHRLTRQ